MVVGYSDRTPAKEKIINMLAGRHGPASVRLGAHRIVYVDLTSGDAQHRFSDQPWEKQTSSANFAYHASYDRLSVPAEAHLYEIHGPTYRKLVAEHSLRLPAFGFKEVGDARWSAQNGRVSVEAHHADGRSVTGREFQSGDSILVCHDPQSPASWALEPRLVGRAEKRGALVMTLSCLGFNAHGAARQPLAKRQQYADRIQDLVNGLPRNHDLLLVALTNDAAKWAYLLSTPRVWRARDLQQMEKIFAEYGRQTRSAYLDDEEGFNDILNWLCTTKRDRGEL